MGGHGGGSDQGSAFRSTPHYLVVPVRKDIPHRGTVYRQFKDINTFMTELNKLLEDK